MQVKADFDFLFQWHLTERCNLSCKHCYQTGEKRNELTLPEIKELIVEISDMVSQWSDAYGMAVKPSFNITGGEPFLHEDLFEVLEDLRKLGSEVFLLTNGILITEESAKFLSWLGISGVQVSIEGPEEVHEKIRGKGSFASSLTGVRHLIDAGMRVTLNVTLSEANAGYLDEIVDISNSQGVGRLGFSRLVPSGRGSGMLKDMLSKERSRELYKRIFSAGSDRLKITTGDPVASQMSSAANEGEGGSIPVGGCAAGVSGMTILPDGTILPCRRLNVPIGNVRSDSLRELWATSPVLGLLRDKKNYKGKCGSCKRWSQCRGCRAIAYAYSQSKGEDDYLAEDPQCFIDESETS